MFDSFIKPLILFLCVFVSSGFSILWTVVVFPIALIAGNLLNNVVAKPKAAERCDLYVFPQSHFVDKVRMIIGQCDVSVVEHGLPSGLTMLLRGFSAPTLVYKGRSALGDSADIARFLMALEPEKLSWLRPRDSAARVDELEKLADRIFVKTRLFAYNDFFTHSDGGVLAKKLMFQPSCTPSWIVAAKPLFYPFCREFVKFGLGITPKGAAKAEQRLGEMMDELEKEFGERMDKDLPLLDTEQYSLADIAIAAALGPIVFPKAYGSGFLSTVPLKELPKNLRKMVQATRKRPCGKFCAAVYSHFKDSSKKSK